MSGEANLPVSVFVKKNIQSKIIWEEKNKEFLLDNKMYDVLYVKHPNGNEIIYCYEDGVEEELDLAFIHLYEQGHKNNKGTHKQLPSWSVSDFNIVTTTENTLSCKFISLDGQRFTPGILHRDMDVISPPPQIRFV